jgi:hypothetical protein
MELIHSMELYSQLVAMDHNVFVNCSRGSDSMAEFQAVAQGLESLMTGLVVLCHQLGSPLCVLRRDRTKDDYHDLHCCRENDIPMGVNLVCRVLRHSAAFDLLIRVLSLILVEQARSP